MNLNKKIYISLKIKLTNSTKVVWYPTKIAIKTFYCYFTFFVVNTLPKHLNVNNQEPLATCKYKILQLTSTTFKK